MELFRNFWSEVDIISFVGLKWEYFKKSLIYCVAIIHTTDFCFFILHLAV